MTTPTYRVPSSTDDGWRTTSVMWLEEFTVYLLGTSRGVPARIRLKEALSLMRFDPTRYVHTYSEPLIGLRVGEIIDRIVDSWSESWHHAMVHFVDKARKTREKEKAKGERKFGGKTWDAVHYDDIDDPERDRTRPVDWKDLSEPFRKTVSAAASFDSIRRPRRKIQIGRQGRKGGCQGKAPAPRPGSGTAIRAEPGRE